MKHSRLIHVKNGHGDGESLPLYLISSLGSAVSWATPYLSALSTSPTQLPASTYRCTPSHQSLQTGTLPSARLGEPHQSSCRHTSSVALTSWQWAHLHPLTLESLLILPVGRTVACLAAVADATRRRKPSQTHSRAHNWHSTRYPYTDSSQTNSTNRGARKQLNCKSPQVAASDR